jgi:hypothetical protein
MRVNPLVPLAFRTLQTLRKNQRPRTLACGSHQCTCRFAQSMFAAFPDHVGFTSIFTKQDEVVDWRACIDAKRQNWEVSGGHLSLIVNRAVYRVLVSTLATGPQSSA